LIRLIDFGKDATGPLHRTITRQSVAGGHAREARSRQVFTENLPRAASLLRERLRTASIASGEVVQLRSGSSDVARRRQTLPKAAPAEREPHKRQAAAVLAQRHRLMMEIASLQKSGRRSPFTTNAEQLLTRWWASASWSARRQLLKTVSWLLHLDASSLPRRGRVDAAQRRPGGVTTA
jgi:hypothetical protein